MNRWERKVWIQKNKGKLIKRGTIILSVLLLVVGVIYITYSKFESTQEFTIINGKVTDSGDIKILSYEYDGESKNVPPAKNSGYGLIGYECTNGAIAEWDYNDWSVKISNLSVKTKCTLRFDRGYTISYNLDGGTLSNKNIEFYQQTTDSFTLNNPVSECYTFVGWSGTDIDGVSENVTIPKGSTGNRSYTANWKKKYLFNTGNECHTITGGWNKWTTNTNDGEEPAYSINTGNSLKIYSFGTSGRYSWAYASTKLRIDISGYDRLVLNYIYRSGSNTDFSITDSSGNETIGTISGNTNVINLSSLDKNSTYSVLLKSWHAGSKQEVSSIYFE